MCTGNLEKMTILLEEITAQRGALAQKENELVNILSDEIREHGIQRFLPKLPIVTQDGYEINFNKRLIEVSKSISGHTLVGEAELRKNALPYYYFKQERCRKDAYAAKYARYRQRMEELLYNVLETCPAVVFEKYINCARGQMILESKKELE